MIPDTYNTDLIIGTDFVRKFTLKNSAGVVIDLTGYDVQVFIENSSESTVTFDELNITDGHIVLVGASGYFTLTIPKAEIIAYTFSKAFYYIQLTAPGGGVVNRYVEGTFTRR